jgi:RNA polymerase sigma factor (sigma-70 family)
MIPVLTPTANEFIPMPLTCGSAVDKIPRLGADASDVRGLTRGLAAGNETAFRKFYELYFDRLYRFLLVVARGQEQEAQEAVQQTLLRVLRYAREFDSEEAFWDWLRVLARSTARDAGRKQKRYSALLEQFALRLARQNPSPACSEEEHLKAALDESLAELARDERRLLEAKYLEGLTVKEISDETRLSEKAIESRLGRIRHSVRKRILERLEFL